MELKCVHCGQCEDPTGGKCCGCTGSNFVVACLYCSIHNDAALVDPPGIAEMTEAAARSRLSRRRSGVVPPLSFSPGRDFTRIWSQQSPRIGSARIGSPRSIGSRGSSRGSWGSPRSWSSPRFGSDSSDGSPRYGPI